MPVPALSASVLRAGRPPCRSQIMGQVADGTAEVKGRSAFGRSLRDP